MRMRSCSGEGGVEEVSAPAIIYSLSILRARSLLSSVILYMEGLRAAAQKPGPI